MLLLAKCTYLLTYLQDDTPLHDFCRRFVEHLYRMLCLGSCIMGKLHFFLITESWNWLNYFFFIRILFIRISRLKIVQKLGILLEPHQAPDHEIYKNQWGFKNQLFFGQSYVSIKICFKNHWDSDHMSVCVSIEVKGTNS